MKQEWKHTCQSKIDDQHKIMEENDGFQIEKHDEQFMGDQITSAIKEIKKTKTT